MQVIPLLLVATIEILARKWQTAKRNQLFCAAWLIIEMRTRRSIYA
jgi:hypothetical protein